MNCRNRIGYGKQRVVFSVYLSVARGRVENVVEVVVVVLGPNRPIQCLAGVSSCLPWLARLCCRSYVHFCRTKFPAISPERARPVNSS